MHASVPGGRAGPLLLYQLAEDLEAERRGDVGRLRAPLHLDLERLALELAGEIQLRLVQVQPGGGACRAREELAAEVRPARFSGPAGDAVAVHEDRVDQAQGIAEHG